ARETGPWKEALGGNKPWGFIAFEIPPPIRPNVVTDLETLEQPSDYWNRTPLLCKVETQGLV
ncbi:hypothetical protein AVEN_11730-1, partial [Araneus ventricosus]